MISISQASILTGKHRTTILRAIQGGKIPHQKNRRNEYLLDRRDVLKRWPDTTETKIPTATQSAKQRIEILENDVTAATQDRDLWKERAISRQERIDEQRQSMWQMQNALEGCLTATNVIKELAQAVIQSKALK